MTRLATTGNSSCAMISIAGFKDPDMDINKKYMEDKNSFKKPKESACFVVSGNKTKAGNWKWGKSKFTVNEFYDKILYPTTQPLGCTGDYPFERLMEEIEESEMWNKLILITLNSYQRNVCDKYWEKQLARWDFKLVDMTRNEIGSMCYIYIRNFARPDSVNKFVVPIGPNG